MPRNAWRKLMTYKKRAVLAVTTALLSATSPISHAASAASPTEVTPQNAVALVAKINEAPSDTLEGGQGETSAQGGELSTSETSSETPQGRTTIPLNPEEPIVYQPEGSKGAEVAINLPKNLDLETGEVRDNTIVTYESKDANLVMTAESVEGGARIHSVIGDPSAPHIFKYPLDLPDGAHWKQYEDGSIVFLDKENALLSMIAPPWAADAIGKPLKTSFTIDGKTLTQTVSVSPGEAKYPLIADPFQGKYLFENLNTKKRYNGKVVYSGTKTAWGQKIHNGQTTDPAGWVGGVIAGQGIMRNEGWAEWTRKWGSQVTSRKTFYQQYSCHVLGGFYNWAGDWNLEAARRDNSLWAVTVASHRCNW